MKGQLSGHATARLLIGLGLLIILWLAYEKEEIILIDQNNKAKADDAVKYLPANETNGSSIRTSLSTNTFPSTAPALIKSIASATLAPTKAPTGAPTKAPTSAPSKAPTGAPSKAPTSAPTKLPTPAPTVTVTAAPDLLQQMNASEILEHFKKHPIATFEQIPQLFPKPSATDNDMIAIYSHKNWQKLHNMLHTRHVTMLVNGGSSMAGAGVWRLEDRCSDVFARLFHNVTVIDRAHGSRNSFHGMQVMHSYFPQEEVDVILWEFAVNDVPSTTIKDDTVAYLEPRNQFILYMDQLARVAKDRGQTPPLVILLYLWSGPFGVSPSGRIKQAVFESHRHVAENYDFVVGHVNAAKYVETWRVKTAEAKAIIIADVNHPNSRGHLILAYLMYDLVTNEQRGEKPKEVNQTSASLTWMCGVESEQKRIAKDLLLTSYPVASFTTESPKNQKQLPGMLSPKVFGNLTLETQDEVSVLPCCSTANITLDVSQYTPLKGIHVNFVAADKGAVIFFDRENVTDQLFDPKSWPCLYCYWSFPPWGTYLVNWVVLSQRRNVSQVLMCNNLPTCGSDPKPENPLAILSFSVYGGK